MFTATPRLDVFIQAFPLGILYRLAMVPRVNIDALYDLVSKPLAQIVRVHGVEFPAPPAMRPLEPCVARVVTFGLDVERRQRVSAIGRSQSDARNKDRTAVFLDAAGQIDLRHVHARRVEVAD